MLKYVAMLLVGALVGCTPDPLEKCRVGMSFDAAAFAAEAGGGAVPDEVTLRQVKFSYKEYAFKADGGDYAVQVSNDGKIIGVWASLPCEEDDAHERVAAIRKRLTELYADKLECCGAKNGEVVIQIKFEQRAKRIVVQCHDTAFDELIERKKKESRFQRVRDT